MSQLFYSKVFIFVYSLALSCTCGWAFENVNNYALNLVATLVGAPGGIAYLAISQTNAEDGFAKLALRILYIAVNTAFYYFVIRYFQKRLAYRTV